MTAVITGHQEPEVGAVVRRFAHRLEREAGEPVLTPAQLADLTALLRGVVVTAADAAPDERWQAEAGRLRSEIALLREQLEQARRCVEREQLTASQRADELRAARQELDEAYAELRSTIEQRDTALGERDGVQARLARVEADLDAAHRARDEQPGARVEPHRHLYPLDSPDTVPGPCACGQVFPWSEPAPARHPLSGASEPSPWEELFARIRREIGQGNDRAARRRT